MFTGYKEKAGVDRVMNIHRGVKTRTGTVITRRFGAGRGGGAAGGGVITV